MAKPLTKQWRNRPLLTETLPYEVPVIFTNDRFYRSVCTEHEDPATQTALTKLFAPLRKYSKPYNYQVRKDAGRSTTLSIVHPLWQLELSEIYTDHEGSLLSYCAKSEFSIRYPSAVAPVYVEQPHSNSTLKDGVVQAATGADDIDPAHVTSYFSYSKFNLLNKFFNSREFLRHEERFAHMRKLDVSKCFYNIYTHTINWAIKEKEFAKEYSDSYSFESRFDRAMQMGNYNETHGIVVGPELSRIFAEIIFQEIDRKIQRDLLQKKLKHEVDYTIRRYVDDFYVFANSTDTLDVITRTIADHLEFFKLYLNTQKAETFKRPFITPLSYARSQVRQLTKDVEALAQDDSKPASVRAKAIRGALHQIRGIVAQNRVEIANVSGWILAWIRRVIDRLNALAKKDQSSAAADIWLDLTRAALEVCLYVCALDLRVRTTYNLCQIVKLIGDAKTTLPSTHFDQVQHLLSERLIAFSSTLSTGTLSYQPDSIELFNVLICGTQFLGNTFTENSKISNLLVELLNSERLTYFRYITLKFCFLKDSTLFATELASLNAIAHRRLMTGEDPRRSSEQFLLLCDYLGSPDVNEAMKREVFNSRFGGVISAAAMANVAMASGFVDWSAVSVEHTLKRKELRPVYAVA